MITISGAAKVGSLLRSLPKQIKFATVRAINATAKEVQRFEVTQQLPSKLTLRAKGAPWQQPGNKFGVNIRFASPERQEATVGSQADWLRLQEEGGQKFGTEHRIAIPTLFWKQRQEIMRREKKPRQILDSKLKERLSKADVRVARIESDLASGQRSGLSLSARRERSRLKVKLTRARSALHRLQRLSTLSGGLQFRPFEAKMPSGLEGIFVRTGKGRIPIKALFVFKDRATVRKRLFFERDGAEVVRKRYRTIFDGEMVKAILTAK